MAENLYHILGFIPATEAWEMPTALESLATAIVHSGKLRINADAERNFVRVGGSHSDKTFTARELTDPNLTAQTHTQFARYVAPAEGPHGIENLKTRLLADLKKARGVSLDKEMKVARVLAQSAHPSVIQLILTRGTELFVSYSHNVGDLLPVHEWQSHGTTSGLQATESAGTAVFVSAGGDPFFEGEHKTYTTDGFPALARMVVIAGQELGHFADLRHTRSGAIHGRHSTDIHHTQLRANPTARDARLSDMQRVAELTTLYQHAGLESLRNAERGVAFYHTRFRYTPFWWWYQLRRVISWTRFTLRTRAQKISLPLRVHPYHRRGDAIEQFLADMAFNLAPDADVYRNPDPLIEEAIAVIEATARVPQQVHKWGHLATQAAWPGLYHFYYGTVIPSAQASLFTPLSTQKLSIFHNLTAKLRRLARSRPGYYP